MKIFFHIRLLHQFGVKKYNAIKSSSKTDYTCFSKQETQL